MLFSQFDEIPAEQISQVAVLAAHGGRWVYVRPAGEAGWRIPCGSIATEESPERAAVRILAEQSGAVAEDLSAVCAYRQEKTGLLFHAHGGVPQPPQNWDAALFVCPPEPLSDPEAERAFFHRVQGWRNLQNAADELWDIYDASRRKTGKLHRRGDPLKPGEYHLAVQVWIRRPDGRFLLTRRAPNKGYPGRWECTGGSALAGDDSLSAALRETQEETGLILQPTEGKLILTFSLHEDTHVDVWLFASEVLPQDIVLQPSETDSVGFFTEGEICELEKAQKLVPISYLSRIFSVTET